MSDFFDDLERLEGGGQAEATAAPSVDGHLHLLADMGRDMAEALDLDDLVRSVLTRLVEITRAERGLLFLKGQGQEPRVFKGVDRYGEPLSSEDLGGHRGVVEEVLSTGGTVVREVAGEAGQPASVLAVPLESHKGRFGVLYVRRFGSQASLTTEDRLLARLVATQASQAIELFRLEEERRRADRIRMENDFLRRLSRRQEEQARVVEALNHELEGRTQELAETSTFLQGILESSTEYAIVALDADGAISAFNTGAANIYGWSSEEVVGRRPLTALFTQKDQDEGLLRRMMQKASGPDGRFAAEIVRLDREGQEVPVRVAMTAIRDPRGAVLGYLDISSDTSSEQELRQQVLLSEKMAALGTLSAGVAHEFNNILQGIIGFLGHALKTDDNDLWRRAMQVSLDAANRASAITGRLQAFARPNVTGLFPVTLPELIDETVALVERSFATDGVAIVCEHGTGLPQVLADRSRLSQVLLNLLTNARHAVSSEELKSVRIASSYDGEWVQVSVTDTGCGIPPEAQSRIFEPFFTTKGALGGKVHDGKVHGTGLGLAISSGIILEHGGRIDVRSRVGEGTTFTLRLKPVGESGTGEAAEGGQGATGDQPPERRLSVLVVDDEDVVRELLREILEERGHAVTTAGNGQQGLEAWRQGAFDVVVADYQMPGMDGTHLLAAVSQEAGELPRRVLVTGRGDESFPSCIDALLRKPFDGDSICAVVEGRDQGDPGLFA